MTALYGVSAAPYFVSAGDMGGSFYKDAQTISEAIATARELRRCGYLVAIYGKDYDADCDERGFFTCNDGLTDDERGLIEEAGL